MPGSNSVDLLLLRHGIAEPRLAGRDHPDRPLTAAGRQRTQLVMAALVRRGVRLDRLLSSPYRRALQTAELALEAGLASELAVDERLEPGGALETLLTAADGRLGLVGHEPDLGDLACGLLGCAPGALVLKKAGVIQLRHSTGQWQVQALLRPSLLIDDLGCC
ncbi:phosphohistidine phosphatase [Synechococcus sp. KORDI-52]|uniref:phosphohistidine phosphatase SixA n=1 Tax=Synechococcus sp. KORDI-52 TaxID=585425 RepID=UPI0004E08DB1|nr:phosphohistidine phosphatase SixA [Synechococcus sp. KORDI-52]AII48323.1 phosphohistidine phosphatase [Synechococcus sp. KORDI-52]